MPASTWNVRPLLARRPLFSRHQKSLAQTLGGCLLAMTVALRPVDVGAASWAPRTGGDWHNVLNWSGGIPQNPGDVATFPRSINVANSQVNLSQPVSLGDLVFANGATLSLTGQPIRFEDLDSVATLSAREGTRPVVVTTPIDVANTLSVNLGAGTSVTLGSSLPATADKMLEKVGPGMLLFHGTDAGWKGSIDLLDGDVATNTTARIGSVVVDGGTLSGKGSLFVDGAVELRTGQIYFDFENPTGLMGGGEIIKRGTSLATIVSLGNGSDRSLRVEEGTVRVVNSSSIGTSSQPTRVASQYAVLHVNPLVTSPIELSRSTGFANSGGLVLEGVIQSTLQLGAGRSIVNPSNFANIQKISGGSLALNGNLLTLTTDIHDYQGVTEIGLPNMTPSRLTLRENGSLQTTSRLIVAQGSTVRLDNATGFGAINRPDRVGDAIPIELNGGTIEYQAATNLENGEVSTERFGDLSVHDGLSRLRTGGNARLFAHRLQRTGPGLFATSAGVNVKVGQGTNLFLDEAPVLENNMVGGWALSGEDFATYTPQDGILPLYSAVTKVEQITQANATSHVSFFGDAAPLTSDRTIASLVSGFGSGEFNLGGRLFNIVSGGWINTGSVDVRNGRLTAGGTTGNRELFLHEMEQVSPGAMTVSAAIVDNSGGAVGVTLSGRIVLSGANTYSGPTRVINDQTRIAAAQSLPAGTDLELAGGWLLLDFEASGPTILGEMSVTERSWIYANDARASRPKINAAKYDFEAGRVSVDLVGSGPMHKATIGRAELSGDNQNFNGPIDIAEGTFFARRPSSLGTGVTTVHPGAMLVNGAPVPGTSIHRLNGFIDMRGGELGVAEYSQPFEWQFEGRLNLLANSTLSLYDSEDGSLLDENAVMTIQSATTIADQVTTRLVGRGTFSFDGELTIGERATIETSEATVRILGTLKPSASSGTLQVDAAKFDWNGAVDVPAGRSLSVRQGNELPDLKFEQFGSSVHGGGKLTNSIVMKKGSELSPGDGIGTLSIDGSVTIGSGTTVRWELGDVGGQAGTGWDLLSVGDRLVFTAVPEAPIVWSIDALATSGFDPQHEYRWEVARGSLIEGFNSEMVVIEADRLRAQFALPDGARFRVSQVANQLELIYTFREAPGDFDNSGVFDVADLDLMTDQMMAGPLADPRFDLTEDGLVNGADREFWVHEIGKTYFGDTNLDGQFSATDLILVFQAGQYEDTLVGNATWATGDWDGDREFSSGDLVTAFQDGGFEAGPRAPAAAVPEPSGGIAALFMAWLLSTWRGRRRCGLHGASLLIALLGSVSLLTSSVQAQQSSWTGASGGLWNAVQNWSNGVANGAGRVALFNTQPQSGLILIDAPVTLEQLVFELPRPLGLSGDVPITFDSTSGNSPQIVMGSGAGPLTISAALRNDPADELLVSTAENASLELKGSLSSASFTLTKSGNGSLKLSGNNANWAGPLLIDAGIVEVLSDSGLGAASGKTTIGPQGTLLAVGDRDWPLEEIHLAGGTLASSTTGSVKIGGPLVVDANSQVEHRSAQGTLQLTGTVSGAGQLTLTQGTLEWRGNSQLTAPLRVANGRLIVAKTFGTPLQIDGGNIDIISAGATSGPLLLNGGLVQLFANTSTYAGRVTLKAGELNVRPSQSFVLNAISAETGNQALVSIGTGGVLTVQGGVNGLGGLSVVNNGSLTFSNQPLTFSGDLTLNGGGTTALSSPVNIGGQVKLNSGAMTLASTGVATIAMSANTTLTVDNANRTYAGSIRISGPATVTSGFGGSLTGVMELSGGDLLVKNQRNGLTLGGQIRGTGNLHLLSQGNGARIHANGGIDLTGNLLVESSGTDDVSTLGASTIRGNLRVAEAPVTFNGPLDLTGDLILDSNRFFTLNALGNRIHGSVVTNQATFLTVNGETTFDSLQLSNGTRLEGMGRIHVTGPLVAGYSQINLTGQGIVGNTDIQVQGVGPLWIGGLGASYTGNVLLNEGVLTLTNSNAIGQGAVVFTGPHARIDTNGSTIGGTIRLNNARGYQGQGALTSGDFTGDIDLGDQSANLGGSLTISGRLHGGGMDIVQGSSPFSDKFVSLTGGGHTLTGEIHMQGNALRRAGLSLHPNASLETPSKFVVGSFGRLEMRTTSDTPGLPNQIADTIPIVLQGGVLGLSNPGAVGEKLGPVTIESGSNLIYLQSAETTYSLASLDLDPMASLMISANVLPTDSSPLANTLLVANRTTEEFLGGNVTIRDTSIGFVSFARYDQQRGILPLAPEDYTPGGPANWTSASHVSVTQTGLLPSDRDVKSLALAFRADEVPVLNLAGHLLNVESGGIAVSGNATISAGRLTAGGDASRAPLTLHVESDYAEFSANIIDNAGPDGLYDTSATGPRNADNGRVSLVKSGSGTAVLKGQNSYSGDTFINDGVMRVEEAGAISAATNVYVDSVLMVNTSEPIRPKSLVLRGGVVSGNQPIVESPLVVLESGQWQATLQGSGEVIKRTDSVMDLTLPLSFTGTLRIEEGTILGHGTFGAGVTQVGPAGTLSGNVNGMIELQGGTLRNTVRIDDPSETIKAGLRVTANSTITSDLDMGATSVTVNSDVVLGPNVTLTKQGRSDLTLGRSITLGDNASIRVESGASQFGYLDSSITFGQNGSLFVKSGLTYVMGTLVPTSSDSQLHLAGDGIFLTDFSVDLKSGYRLSVDTQGTRGPIDVSGTGRFVRGDGVLGNDLFLGDRAEVRPGVNVGALKVDGNVTIEPTTNLFWQMQNAAGQAGATTGWDLLTVANTLHFVDGRTNGVRVEVSGVDANGNPAAVQNFDQSRSQKWVLAKTQQIGGFNASHLQLRVAGFDTNHPLPRGARFSLVSESNEILLQYDVLLGDFNSDRLRDARDFDRMANLVRTASSDLTFDVNFDNRLDKQDQAYWVEQIMGTWFGDANLDGIFDSTDLVSVFQAGRYEDGVLLNAGWASGDWDGNSEFDTSDLVVAFQSGGYNQGRRLALTGQPVPEPLASAYGVIAACVLAVRLRGKRGKQYRNCV